MAEFLRFLFRRLDHLRYFFDSTSRNTSECADRITEGASGSWRDQPV